MPDAERDDRWQEILVAYLEAFETGRPPELAEWLTRYPEFDAELRQFFAAHEHVARLTDPPPRERTHPEAPSDDVTRTLAEDVARDSSQSQLEYMADGDALGEIGPRPLEVSGKTVRYFGDYELLEEVARGGMGVVYRARQARLNRIVALKMILAGRLADPEDVKRFHAEAEAAASLDHPGIVPVYEVGEHEGQHYFSMAFVEGESLADRLHDGPLPPRQAALLAKQIADSIAFAHSRGVIHRDLKPANVLLARHPSSPNAESDDSSGQQRSVRGDADSLPWMAKVTDFGLAKRLAGAHGLTATGQILGTPSYMPPEQASGRTDCATETADVYSLGAILYAMLTGHPPFQADNPLDTLVQVIGQEPVPPRQGNPKISRDLETICLKCLEKEPQRRYPTAQMLADDLERWLGDEPIRARPPGAAEKAQRWFRKQSQSVAVAIAASVVTLVVGVLGLAVSYMYSQWRLGHLSLSTDHPPLVAEVLDEAGRRIIPPRTLPTSEPVPLPAGDYRIQVTGEGRLGQSYEVAIPRGREFAVDVNLEDQTLIPTRDIERSFDAVPRGDQTALILLNNESVTRVDSNNGVELWSLKLSPPPPALRRQAPGFRWPWTVQQGSGPYDGYEHFDLRPQFVGSRRDTRTSVWQPARPMNADEKRLLPPLDINSDGEEDLILATRHQACLLAIGGMTGELLWVAARGSDLHGEAESNLPHARRDHIQSTVVGVPELAGDLDEDGIADVIATFAMRSKSGPEVSPTGRVDATRWVEAISGKTGQTIWRYDIPEAGFQLPPATEVPYAFQLFTAGTGWSSAGGNAYTSGREVIRIKNNRRQFQRSGAHIYAPERARIISPASHEGDSRTSAQQVLVIAGSYVILLDPKTGVPRFPPHDTGCRPVRTAVLADANGDGSTELLFLELIRSVQSRASSDPAVRMIAWSLNPPREKWRSDVGSRYWNSPTPLIPPPDWPLVADLDGDGADEILVPTDPASASGPGAMFPTLPAGWLSALDGKSGKPRWTRKLRTIDSQVDQFAIGPDVDGDGRRDIFVATLLYRETELYVDCLSGADGETIWWTRQRLDDFEHGFREQWVTGLTWWNLGADGWPRLLVNVRSEQRDERNNAVVYAFSAGSGALLGRAPKLEEFHLADADGDGLDELYSFRAWGGRDQGGRLDILRGGPADSWRRLGDGQPHQVGDLDGDGVGDLAFIRQDEQLMAVSGREGKPIWQVRLPVPMREMRSLILGPQQDFNRDGVPDILVVPAANVLRPQLWSPIHLLSGRDGRLLWSARMAIRSMVNPLLLTEFHDLDGDDIPEVILVTTLDYGWEGNRAPRSSSDGNLWLLALSGSDGTVLWNQPLSGVAEDGTLTMTSEPMRFRAGEMQMAVGDLDNDGVPDLLLPAEVPGEVMRFEIRAVSGKTGATLWTRPLSPSRSLTAPMISTAPRIGDIDGDGRNEAIVLEFFDDSDEGLTLGEFVRLTVLDGKSGVERWQWRAPRYWSFAGGHLSEVELLRRPAPHLLRVVGRKESLICVNLWGQSQPAAVDPMGSTGELPSHLTCIAVFDHRGELLSHLPLPGAGDFAIWPLDADQDGGDELVVLTHPEGLRLIRPGTRNETAWQVGARGGSHEEIWGIDPAHRHGAPMIVVKEYERVLGVNAANGTFLWTAEIPQARRGRSFVAAEAMPLIAGLQRRPGSGWSDVRDPHAREETRASPRIAFTYGDVTVVRPANSAGVTGTLPPVDARTRVTPAWDPRFRRPLPWVVDVDPPARAQFTNNAWWATWVAILSLTLVFFPGMYFAKLLSRRNWSLRMLLLAPVIISGVLVALSLPVPVPEYSSWWRKWLVGATAVPLWLIVISLTSWTFCRRWNRIVGWLALTAVTSMAFGVLWIAIDLAVSREMASYNWDGWYWLWLKGIYWCGWLLLPAAVMGWMKKSINRREARSGPNGD